MSLLGDRQPWVERPGTLTRPQVIELYRFMATWRWTEFGNEHALDC